MSVIDNSMRGGVNSRHACFIIRVDIFRMFYETDYLRHSAFRTINGGICLGLSLLRPALAQLLLLEYQRMVNNSIFNGNFSFFSLPNIANLL